jgi:hypothetical protein
MNLRNPVPRRRALLLASGVLAGLLMAYALAGFVLAPWLAKRELPRLAADLGVQARIGKVAFNPFTLRLQVSDVAIEEENGEPILGYRAASADVAWRSLTRGALVFSDVRLQEPEMHVRISEKGELNVAALVRRSAGDDRDTAPPAIALENVVIEDGRVIFEDRRQGYKNSFENLSLSLASVSTATDDKGPYDLVAQTADGGKLSWKGEASLAPLSLSGTLVLEHGALPQINPYLKDYRVTSGRAHIVLSHRFVLAAGKPEFGIQDANIIVDGLALAVRGVERPFATIGRFVLEGASGDLQSRRASAQVLRVGDFSLAATRDAQGDVHPQGLMTPSGAEGDGKGAWQFSIAEAVLARGTFSFADAESGLAWKLERVAARLRGLSSDTTRPLSFEFESGVSGGGRLAATGKAVPATGKLEARVEAAGVPIAPMQQWVARHADVKLLSGSLTAAGELAGGDDTRKRRGSGARLVFSGAASLDNVILQDGAGTPLVQWKALATKSLRLSIAPNEARINDLRWTAPEGRLEIAADGATNLGRVFRKDAKPAPQPASQGRVTATPKTREKPDGTATAGSPRNEAGDFPIRIRRVQVDKGTLDFADRSLSPHFSTLIHDLAGTVNGISTDRSTRSQLALEGRVNEFGHARLSGALNLFAPEQRTSFRVQIRNLEVARLSPYTIKFAGYRVNSGRMSLDLNYRVNDSRLEGDNKIVLDDFTLGERVAGTEATVPLELAVSLLKDADGRIDIGVPISGSLEDPDFKLGDVIWKAIGNIVRNVISAPFQALGRLFGAGSEKLAAIAFEPGGSRLLPPEQEKLRRIADGLARRPDLKVLVPARYDAEADAMALKRAALRREISRRAGLELGDGDAPGPISVEDRRTRNALRGLFAERFGDDELEQHKADAERNAAHDGKPPELSIGERVRRFASGEPRVADLGSFYRSLFRRLLESQPLPDAALDELAQKRAAAIAEGLRAGGADAARVELSSAEPTTNAGAREVTVRLSLAPAR